MLNFAVGPVTSCEEVLKIGGNQVPYFRTEEFSKVVFGCEEGIKQCLNAPEGSRVIFMTGSGTASMEAAVINCFGKNDKLLIVDGGSFGRRFCEICSVHGIEYTAVKCEAGKTLKEEQLAPYENKGYTGFLVNLCETSTGVLYDLKMISSFCKRNSLFLVVDAISAFLCDRLDMSKYGVNVAITGSQKALALAPGLSLICVDKVAQTKIAEATPECFYFDLKSYLKNGERGQTPFTPAVGIILQLEVRLNAMKKVGIEREFEKSARLAAYFRNSIKDLPLKLFADVPSNAVTSLTLTDTSKSAYKVFEELKDGYGIFVCPNGGDLKEKVFRVGHMGDLSEADYDTLVSALKELQKRRVL